MHSDGNFCDVVTATVPFLICALAVCATVSSTSWALLILSCFFLSVCLVAGFSLVCREIAMVVVVGDKKREKRDY